MSVNKHAKKKSKRGKALARQTLPVILQKAVENFDTWSATHLAAIEEASTITVPLYHYTDAAGLEGLIKTQQVWFTSYLHLNDTSELTYGMAIASKLLKEIGNRSDARIRLFCEMVGDLFTHENMQSTFGFFIGSFSQARNDLGQWRAYGDDGRGFALGLAPNLFHVADKADRKPHENVFVTPVVYGEEAGRERHRPAIEKAVVIVASTIDHAANIMRHRATGLAFLDRMAKSLIASQLIWNSLTIKHEAYEHEQEIRLIIMGETKKLQPYVSTRARGSEIVPFIKNDMAIQERGSIVKVVIGPSAAPNSEDSLRTLLRPFHNDPDSLITRSGIPYRGR
jgi:hypothetical protein